MPDGAVMSASPSTELHWLPSDDTTTQEEAVYLYAIEKIYIYVCAYGYLCMCVVCVCMLCALVCVCVCVVCTCVVCVNTSS